MMRIIRKTRIGKTDLSDEEIVKEVKLNFKGEIS